jgi:hypothetical protein
MATYGEVKTEFTALLNRRDATSTQITTFLQNAIRRVQRTLRTPAMETGVIYTITDFDAPTGLPIPSNYLELVRLTNSDGHELVRRDFTTVTSLAEDTGVPWMFARRGSYWLIGPTPEEGDTVRADFYGEFEEVEDDEDTNLLTVTAPDLMVYGALVFACKHFHDKRLADFEATFNQIMGELMDQADRDELSGGAVMSLAHPYPSDC